MNYYSAVTETPARDRLLLAGARLLHEAAGGEVSTRAICEQAGVTAPALYHHFGSKQALLDMVVSHGLRQFLAERESVPDNQDDPIAAIRAGWDVHVQFGLSHPAFYAHVYGHVEPGRKCGVVSEVEAMILATLEPAARQGRLTVPAEQAAAEILAASSGVVLTLITSPDVAGLSARVREAVLGGIVADAPQLAGGPMTASSAAIALSAALADSPDVLGAPETALFRSWLSRVATGH